MKSGKEMKIEDKSGGLEEKTGGEDWETEPKKQICCV